MAERLWSAGDLTNEELARQVSEVADNYTTGYDESLLREAAGRLRECDPTRVGPLRVRLDQRADATGTP